MRWNTAEAPEEALTLSEKPKSVKITFEARRCSGGQKTFSTGSRDIIAQGRIEIAGKRYQIGVTIVEIGSKPYRRRPPKAS